MACWFSAHGNVEVALPRPSKGYRLVLCPWRYSAVGRVLQKTEYLGSWWVKLIARWMDAPKSHDVTAITRSRFVELRETCYCPLLSKHKVNEIGGISVIYHKHGFNAGG